MAIQQTTLTRNWIQLGTGVTNCFVNNISGAMIEIMGLPNAVMPSVTDHGWKIKPGTPGETFALDELGFEANLTVLWARSADKIDGVIRFEIG